MLVISNKIPQNTSPASSIVRTIFFETIDNLEVMKLFSKRQKNWVRSEATIVIVYFEAYRENWVPDIIHFNFSFSTVHRILKKWSFCYFVKCLYKGIHGEGLFSIIAISTCCHQNVNTFCYNISKFFKFWNV